MKRITGEELKQLSFGTVIRVIFCANQHHEEQEYLGVIFGSNIGYADSFIAEVENIANCADEGQCIVYLMSKEEDQNEKDQS